MSFSFSNYPANYRALWEMEILNSLLSDFRLFLNDKFKDFGIHPMDARQRYYLPSRM